MDRVFNVHVLITSVVLRTQPNFPFHNYYSLHFINVKIVQDNNMIIPKDDIEYIKSNA